MSTSSCPTADRLVAFQTGKLPHSELNSVAAHVETCATCLTVLERVSTMQDSLVKELQHARPTGGFSEEAVCRRAVAHAASLLDEATHTRDDTADHGSDAGIANRMLGKYQLVERIGQGGMGTVFKAIHTLLKRTVALKVLAPNRLKDPQAVSRFRREIEAAGKLDHPHIVRTSDADTADGQHFLVMEWLPGQDLAKYVRERGPLPIDEACEFIRQAALGLECAHQHGMVHRDVKPSNLLATPDSDGKPMVKVLDLGLALLQVQSDAEKELTSADRVMGTYDFIAPEQAMNAHNVDGRADIYSLGATFYFLLTGQAPFHGVSETKKLIAHQLEEPTPINKLRKEVPVEVAAMIGKMMAKDPARRFRSMREVADQLAERASLPSPPGRGAGGEGVPRSRLLIAGAVVLALSLVVAITFGIIRISTPESDFVVETDDPDISFSVSKNVVTLHDKQTRDYTLKAVRGPGGEFVLDVSEVGPEVGFNTKEFTIKRGDKQVALKAWFERKRPEVAVVVPKELPGDTKQKPSPVLPPIYEQSLTLDITTKLGVKTRVEIASIGIAEVHGRVLGSLLYSRTDTMHLRKTGKDENGLGRICIDQGNGAFVLIPIRQVQRVEAEDKQHVVILTDDSKHRGKLATAITGKDGKTYQLADAQSIVVRTDKPDRPADTKAGTTRLTLAESPNQPVLLTNYLFQSGMHGFGKEFKMHVDGAKLQPNLDDFDKVVLTPDAANWTIQVTAPNSKAVAGSLDIVGSGGRLSWWFIGETRNDWLIVIGHHERKAGFTLEKIKADARPSAGKPGDQRQYIGHQHTVGGMAFAPHERTFLTGSDGELWLWDVEKREVIRKFMGPKTIRDRFAGWVRSVAFSADGKQALSGARDGQARLWEVESGTQLRSVGDGKTEVTCVAFAPDRKHFLYAAGDVVYLCDLESMKVVNKFSGRVACFLEDGKKLLTARNNTLYLWDTATGNEISQLDGHANAVFCLAVSANGQRAVSGSFDGVVRIWDLQTGKLLHLCKGHKGLVQSVAFSPDHRTVLSGAGDKTAKLWDAESGKEYYTFTKHDGPVTCVAFTADGRQALTSDVVVRFWVLPERAATVKVESRVITWPKSAPLAKHADAVTHLAASDDGTKIVSYSKDSLVSFWQWDADKNTLTQVWKRDFPRVQSIAITPDGQHALIAIHGNSRLTHVNTRTQDAKDKLGLYGATSVLYSADGRRYLTGTSYGGFSLFDWPDGTLLRDFAGRDHPIRQLAFSSEAKRILSAGGDKTIRLWDSTNAKELGQLPVVASDKSVIALSQDGTRALIAQNDDNSVHLWNLSTLKVGAEFKGHDDQITALTFTSDGRFGVSASRDRTLRIWDLVTSKEWARLEGHSGDVTCVIVLAENRRILSASRDGTVRIWPWPQ